MCIWHRCVLCVAVILFVPRNSFRLSMKKKNRSFWDCTTHAHMKSRGRTGFSREAVINRCWFSDLFVDKKTKSRIKMKENWKKISSNDRHRLNQMYMKIYKHCSLSWERKREREKERDKKSEEETVETKKRIAHR